MAETNKKYSDYYRETHIMQLIDDGKLDWAEVLLQARESVNQPGESGGTPLQVAITRRNIRAVLLLLKYGVDVNLSYPVKPGDKNHISPLLHALQDKQAVTSTLLIRTNAILTQKDQDGQTALHHAIKVRSQPVIDLLLKRNPIINAKDNKNKTPLMLSAEVGDIFTLEKLLVRDATVDDQDSSGKTALMIAAEIGNTNIVRALLQNRASVDLQDSKGSSAILLAAYKSSTTHDRSAEYLSCIELLIKAKADVNLLDARNNSPLMIACKYGKTKENVVTSLLEAGSYVDESDDEEETPLHKLIYSGETNIQSILMEYGADVNRQNGQSETPLEIMATDPQISHTDKELKMLHLLLDAGADPDLKAVMCLAASNYKTEMVKLLLQAGADINIASPLYGSVLFNAAYVGSHEMAKIALQYNTKINICVPNGVDVHPEEPDKFALMLTFAAGEKCQFFDVADFHIPRLIRESREDISLMNLSRNAIRKFITRDNGDNLFEISKILPLPLLLKNYIVFDMSPTETKEECFERIQEPDYYDFDSDDSDLEDCINY